MDEELEQAQGLLAAGDVPGRIRHLRAAGANGPATARAGQYGGGVTTDRSG